MIINILECKGRIEQYEKLIEERSEVDEAFYNKDKEHLITELWDEVQVLLGMILIETKTKEKFIESYNKHDEKMDNYDIVGRIKIIDRITL